MGLYLCGTMTKTVKFSTATNVSGSRVEEVLEIDLPDDLNPTQIEDHLSELLVEWVMLNTDSFYREV